MSAGAGIRYGVPIGLMTFGSLVIVLSIYAVERLRGR